MAAGHQYRDARSIMMASAFLATRHASAITSTRPTEPNALWCADYKGEFMLGNRRYCYPLTITDFASRYLLICEALSTTQKPFALTAFDRAFKDFGCPPPFAPTTALPVRLTQRALSPQ